MGQIGVRGSKSCLSNRNAANHNLIHDPSHEFEVISAFTGEQPLTLSVNQDGSSFPRVGKEFLGRSDVEREETSPP